MTALVIVLAALYTLFYSGRIESGDSLRMFDATGSLAEHGDTWIDRAAYQFPPALSDVFRVDTPLTDASIEPMQMIAAAPLYALASMIPGLGLLHTVWMFNVLVTALAGGLFYGYALALGYRERTAVAAALMLGAFTILLPYARTFFREPLTLLCILAAALALERLRALHYRSRNWGIVVLIAVVALTLTKASGLLALPALLIVALPALYGRRGDAARDRRAWIVPALGIGLAAALLIGVFVLLGVVDLIPALSERYSLLRRLSGLRFDVLGTALAAYLISPGGSLWGTSPVLLLTIPGAWLLVRAGRVRSVLVAAALLGAFAFGYALLNGDFWFGGLSWPPRFLVPVVPLIWVLALPIIDRLIARPSLWLIPVIGLVAYSIYVQAGGVLVFGVHYADALPPEANRFVEWAGGLYDPRFFRWSLLPALLDVHPPDLAWWSTDAPQWPLSMAAIITAGLGVLAALLHTADRPLARRRLVLTGGLIAGLGVVFIVVTGLHLGRLYRVDARHLSADDSLHRAVEVLRAETRPDDVILLSSPRYAPYFLNAAPRTTFDTPPMGRIIALPLQPGDRPSPEEAPRIESDNAAALVHSETLALIGALAASHDRLWLLVNGSPDLWWSVRPVERYLSAYYYPLRYIQTGDNTRLIEYATIPAPDPYLPYAPSQPADLVFGDALRLTGIELPVGDTFSPGDAVPVSLTWSVDDPVTANYTVALFLRRADGNEVAQTDWQPGGGFSPSSGWTPDARIWDHRAVRLPTDLPAGTYALWVKVYDFAPDGTRRDLPVTAGTFYGDDTSIGVLPVSITVRGG